MFSQKQMHDLFEKTFEQMLLSQWITHFVFTDGKGWAIDWTEQGAENAICLKRIIETFRLTEDDRAPLAFDVSTKGGSFPNFSYTVPEEISIYWGDRVKELGYSGDGDGLLALAHIVKGWAP